ncbi:MAG: ribosome silencing factor [Faecalibacterium sp.]
MENLHLEQFDLTNPEQLAIAVAKVLHHKKANDVKVLKVEDVTMLTSYFVIASGNSTTHVGSLADDVEYEIGKVGNKPYASEGYDSKNWILLDYASVIVHVFVPNTRTYYDLEHLWADGVPVDVSAYLNEEEA